MLKFTYHSLKRAKERGLSLDVIADLIVRSYVELQDKKTRIPAEGMTVVAKKEGKEAVVITAWENEKLEE